LIVGKKKDEVSTEGKTLGDSFRRKAGGPPQVGVQPKVRSWIAKGGKVWVGGKKGNTVKRGDHIFLENGTRESRASKGQGGGGEPWTRYSFEKNLKGAHEMHQTKGAPRKNKTGKKRVMGKKSDWGGHVGWER